MKLRLSIIIIAVTIAFYFVACEKSDEAQAAQDNSVQVYNITKAEKAGPGKAHNFYWEENGQEISFKDYTKNKVVFLNIWGTWCPPCRRELPDIQKIHEESGKDLVIVGVASNERGRTAAERLKHVREFAKKNGLTYKILISNDRKLESFYGIRAVPTTYIVDKQGNIGETLVGARPKSAFEQSIKRIMNK